MPRLEEDEKLVLTPFEKNIEVWRQLWRVLERSDIVVQVGLGPRVVRRRLVLAVAKFLFRWVRLENLQEEEENPFLLSAFEGPD